MNIIDNGKNFLNYYNKVEKTNYNAKDFFCNIIWPIFFDCPQNKHLVFYQNSKFSNPSLRPKYLKHEDRVNLLDIFNSEISEEKLHMIGEKAHKDDSTTSGCVGLHFDNNITEEDIYLSWIEYVMMFDINAGDIIVSLKDEKLKYQIFKTHARYRELLSDKLYEKFDGKEIHNWNSLMLLEDLDDISNINPFDKLNDKDKNISFKHWLDFFYNLSKKIDNKSITISLAKYGKTVNTYGYVIVDLNNIRSFFDLCEKEFGKNDYVINSNIYREVFGKNKFIDYVIALGQFGMKSISPKLSLNLDSFKYIEIYFIMNNNKKDVDILKEFSQQLVDMQYEYRRTKIDDPVKNLLKSFKPIDFISSANNIMEIIQDDVKNQEFMKTMVEFFMNNKPNFSEYSKILKFYYEYNRSIKKNK